MKNQIFSSLLLATVVIPVTELNSWRMEAYSKIPSNQVSVTENKLQIRVQKSASPLISPLKEKTKIIGFKIAGEFKSLPKFQDVAKQGQKGFDDFPLRIGFIVPGSKQLSGVKKLLAPDWIKNLYRQLPEGQGLDHIAFFNVVQNSQLIGTSRMHPGTDLITESFISLVNSPGPFDFSYTLKEPINAAAIWLSIDGDDTKSDFEVTISKLELQTE